MTERTVRANGIEIWSEDFGKPTDPALLLVMGAGGQGVLWPDELCQALAAGGRRVIRYDNRDTGQSTCLDFAKSPYTLSDMARDAIGVLDALGIDTANVVGMSMGGMIAQEIAIQHPTRVRSLTSIMSTTGNPRVGRPKMRLVRKALRRKQPTLDNAIDLSIETFRDVCGPTFDAEQFRALAEKSIARSFRPDGTSRQLAAIIASPDRTDALTRLRVPTLVIHGMLDPLVQPSGGLATARAIPGAKLVMYNDMAHDLPHTRWKEIADEIASIAARAPQPVGATA